jgi:muramoyltetrapeptide carboxypeptidase
VRAKRLASGSRVGIVSPSTPVTPDQEKQLENGVAFLSSLGLDVAIGRNVRSTTLGYTAAPQEKADDINHMFADPGIDAIICSQGGANANACLAYLDWDAIAKNPKVFLGISDITVLLDAIYAKAGLITFHGNDLLWGLGRNPTEYDQVEFISRLMEGQTGTIKANGSRKTVRSGVGEGVLIGGNLSCLLKLAGTEFFPNFEAGIFFVEALSTTSRECDYMFYQLKQMGVFSKIRGAIIGHIDGLERTPDEPQMDDILLRITAEYDFPILKVSDFGHNCPNTVLPIGGKLRMDSDKQSLELTSAFLE